jgi:hypothetical protein
MADVLEIDALTGDAVERDFTEDEALQRAADEAAAIAAAAEQAEKEAAAAVARDAAIEHAKSLGFTDDMIAVMYPNLAPQ